MMNTTAKSRPQLPTGPKSTVSPVPQSQPEVVRAEKPEAKPPTEEIMVNLGFGELIDLDGGYIPSRPELDLTEKARKAIKRLSLTLDQREERLSDGTVIGPSVAKSIVWLCERFADAVPVS
jgi:hypothetical protein